MTFVVRMESEHVASLTATKELLIRIREAFGCDCQALIDDLEDLLFRAEQEQKLPRWIGVEDNKDVARFSQGSLLRLANPEAARDLLRLARERGLMPDEPYELNDPKSDSYHSVHADIWDKRDGK